MFLIYADFRTSTTFSMNDSMKGELNTMFGDILNQRLDSDIASLYVILNSIVYIDPTIPGPPRQQEMTLLFKLKPSDTGAGNDFEYCQSFECRTGDAGSLDVQQHILQQVGKLHPVLNAISVSEGEAFTDEEIFMITWDHGNGFGIFFQDTPQLPTATTSIDHQLDQFEFLKAFWDRAMQESAVKQFIARKNDVGKKTIDIRAGFDLYTVDQEDVAVAGPIVMEQSALNAFDLIRDKDSIPALIPKQRGHGDNTDNTLRIKLKGPLPPEILMNGELARVIEQWLNDSKDRKYKKLSVLLMLNCSMMNLHTLYSLRNVIKFLVAPQSLIDNPGYNYRDILNSIYNSPALPMTPERLSENIVCFSHNTFFKDSAATLNIAHPDTIDLRTIVNIRLDYPGHPSPIDRLIKMLKQIVTQLNILAGPKKDPDNSVRHLLKYVRQFCFNFTDEKIPMIDLPNFLSALVTVSSGLNPEIIQGDLKTAIKDLQNNAQEELPGIKTRFIGQNAYYVEYKPPIEILTGRPPTGYSIYFPVDVPNMQFTDIVKNDQLLKDFPEWRSLIDTIYDIKLPD